MIVAIVPAAGKSVRMKRPKLLLPLGRRLVIEHLLDALTQTAIETTFVVVPPGAEALLAVLQPFEKVIAVPLDAPTRDMRESIVAGLAFVEATMSRTLPEAFFVAPADQPTTSPQVVTCLIDHFRRERVPIVVPVHEGKRGHPVLLSWSMVPQVRAIPADRGLNDLIARSVIAECPVPEEGVLADLDTPEDYERLSRSCDENPI
jgi:molybdenum cofactor cytidylyltransferase